MNKSKLYAGFAPIAVILIVAGILLAGGTGYYIYKQKKSTAVNSGGNNLVCAQEVLLCPDGSYVARDGANQCKFSGCPNKGPFLGKLEQLPGSFRLLMDSPDKSNQGEITYSLPLQIKVSNALAQLINQKVSAYGAFADGNNFIVDRLEEVIPSDPSLGDVSVGQTIFINGIRVKLNQIVNDSRCPVDAQCIQAGSLTANVTLKSDTDSQTLNMTSGKPPIGFDSFLVSIQNVKPNKIASHPDIGSQYYILTFKVVGTH